MNRIVNNIILEQNLTYLLKINEMHISLYFFITLFKFYKNVCKEMCTNHDLFFLLVHINLN
jgi:hypothetical protein